MGILLLILLQFCQSSGGIISDLCRSQSLGTSHSTVCCIILSVERCSLGNTSLHRDEMTPPLQEYSSVLYCTILYYTIQYNTIQYNTIQYNTIQYNTRDESIPSYAAFLREECWSIGMYGYVWVPM